MKYVLPLMIAGLLVAPSPASAGWQIDRAEAIAQVVWHHGPLEIRLTDEVPANAEGAAGWSYADTNIINLDVNNDSMDYWETFCSTVLHEAGHVAGYRDPLNTADPHHSHLETSVMYATPTRLRMDNRTDGHWTRTWSGTDRRCAHRGRPYLERHGILKPRRRANIRLGCADGQDAEEGQAEGRPGKAQARSHPARSTAARRPVLHGCRPPAVQRLDHAVLD